MTQGHVAATRPLVLVLVHTFTFVTHESCYNFVPATCRTKFNLLNFVGHVAGTKLCRDAMSLRSVHRCAKRSCNRIIISANHKQRPEFFALFHWEKTWRPWIVEFALIGIDKKAYYCINGVDG